MAPLILPQANHISLPSSCFAAVTVATPQLPTGTDGGVLGAVHVLRQAVLPQCLCPRRGQDWHLAERDREEVSARRRRGPQPSACCCLSLRPGTAVLLSWSVPSPFSNRVDVVDPILQCGGHGNAFSLSCLPGPKTHIWHFWLCAAIALRFPAALRCQGRTAQQPLQHRRDCCLQRSLHWACVQQWLLLPALSCPKSTFYTYNSSPAMLSVRPEAKQCEHVWCPKHGQRRCCFSRLPGRCVPQCACQQAKQERGYTRGTGCLPW